MTDVLKLHATYSTMAVKLTKTIKISIAFFFLLGNEFLKECI